MQKPVGRSLNNMSFMLKSVAVVDNTDSDEIDDVNRFPYGSLQK